MKKIGLFFLCLAMTAGLSAQSAEDALNFAQEYYEGTARTMAMGNAFTALGGDLGAIGLNPASSGVLRYSQITFSPALITSRSAADYLGRSSSAKNTGLSVSNFGTVITFDTRNYRGLLNYNIGFVYNKKNSFRSYLKAAGSTDQTSMLSAIAAGLEGIDWADIDLEEVKNPFASSHASWPGILAWNTYALAPLSALGGKYADVNDSYIASTENYNPDTDELQIGGMLDQRFIRKSLGSNEEFALNFGGNINDRLFFGVNLNFLSIDQTVEEYYEERAAAPDRFDDGFVSMDNSFWLHTIGGGFNMKFGVILTPFAGLRLGATLSTPTWYTLTDQWDYTMNTAFNNGNSYTGYSPTGTYDYRVTAPMRWSVAAAYTFFGKGLLSADYERVNYADTRLLERRDNEGVFAGENDYAEQHFNAAHIFRLGAEIRATDRMSLRGGYQNYAPAVKGASGRSAWSAGLGYSFSPAFSLDLAWTRLSDTTESFRLYEDYSTAVKAPTGNNTHSLNKIVCTLGIKF